MTRPVPNLPNASSWVIGMLCLWIAFPCLAEFESEGWLWKSDIVSDLSDPGFVRLELSPEIIEKSQLSLNDFRIVDANGNLTPHIIHRQRPALVERVEHTVRLINRTHEKGEYARVTLDFGKRTLKNHVEVSLSGQNYRRFAQLEGSPDGERWELVETTWLFRIEEPGRTFNLNSFRFSPNDFRYLQLTVFNMEDETDEVEVVRVSTSHYATPEKLPSIDVPLKVWSVEPEEGEENQTLFEMDLGYKHLRASELHVQIDEPYFYRAYELYGRNAAKTKIQRRNETGWGEVEIDIPWRSVSRGVFYRVHRDQEITEVLAATDMDFTFRYAKLHIFNRDDQPLNIKPDDISMARPPFSTVVFSGEQGERYTLYFANDSAKRPDYDLAESKRDLGVQDLPTVSLGTIEEVSDAAALLPWSERYRSVIWLVLLAIVAMMIGLIVANMNRFRPE